MAQKVMMKNPQTGLMKKGFYGFSWTMFLFGFWVPIIRGDLRGVLLALVIAIFTLGLGFWVWAFFYNKQYTTRLIEKGYQFADNDAINSMARLKLGVA